VSESVGHLNADVRGYVDAYFAFGAFDGCDVILEDKSDAGGESDGFESNA
jgi:hypothetical protein